MSFSVTAAIWKWKQGTFAFHVEKKKLLTDFFPGSVFLALDLGGTNL